MFTIIPHNNSTVFYIYISNFKSQITYSFVKCGFIVFLTLSTLICQGTDISKCFSEFLGIRDNESRVYIIAYLVRCKPRKTQISLIMHTSRSESSEETLHSCLSDF